MSSEDEKLSRRSYLKFAGVATTTVGIAGCTGGDGDGDGDGDGGTTPTDAPGMTEAPEQTEAPEETQPSEDTEERELSDIVVGITMGNMDSGLDPHDHAETNTEIVVGQGYEFLLDRDADGRVIPELATEWRRVEEGAAYFRLRDGVRFHNGDPLTPEDVAYSIRRVAFNDVGFPSPQATNLGSVSGVQPGEQAVSILYHSLNPVAFQLITANGNIMQKSWVEGNDRDFINRNMNGTGPFQLTNYDSGNQVDFERFDDYWNGPASVGGVKINASTESSTRVNRLLAGESDIVTNVPAQEVPRVQNSEIASISPVPSTRIIFLQMKTSVEPFTSVEFRQAMNYAVDVESIIENVLSGFGAITGQPTLPQFTGYNPDVEPYPYDPDMAEQLVDESGFAGAEITLQTPIGRYLGDVEIAQAAAAQISELPNVTCAVQQRDFGALVQDLLAGFEQRPDFTLLGWGNSEFDATGTIVDLLTSQGFLTVLKNDEVDGLIEQAQNEPDAEAREGILKECNALLHDLAPWVYLHQQFSVYGVSNRIEWTPLPDEFIDPFLARPN